MISRKVTFAYISLDFVSHTMSLFPGLTCKACSLDVLSHEWDRKSTDALNNNLRPKSDCHGTLTAKNHKRYQIPPVICSEEEEDSEEDREETGGEEVEEENISISNESRCLYYHTYKGLFIRGIVI